MKKQTINLFSAFILLFFSSQIFAQLPDFTVIVEDAKDSVVNISTSKKPKTSQLKKQLEMPDFPEDSPFGELFKKFFDHDGFGLANFYKADSLLTSTEDLEPQLHLYPNPTNSKFTIELYSADNTSTLVRVYDTSANLIYSSEKDLIRFDVNKIEIPRLENRTVFIVVVDFKNTRLEGKIVITE